MDTWKCIIYSSPGYEGSENIIENECEELWNNRRIFQRSVYFPNPMFDLSNINYFPTKNYAN